MKSDAKPDTKRIVIDTRENRPYEFDNSVSKALRAGDYSVEGFEDRVAVERKSLDDWIGTVLRARKRFARELNLLKTYDYAAIVIEASPDDISAKRYKSEINPAALLGMTCELAVRFRPVQVVFGGSRPMARVIAEKLLRFAARQVEQAQAEQVETEEVEAEQVEAVI